MASTPEGKVLAACIEWLAYQPKLGYFYRTNNIPAVQYVKGEMVFRRMPKYSAPGLPDISGVLTNGRACYIECKAPGKYQSPDQKEFQRKVESLGGVYILARSLDDLQASLKVASQGLAVAL